MALTEVPKVELPSPGVNNPYADRYSFVINGQSFVADIGDHTDPRLQAARDMEIDTFAELGDRPEEVREEFDPHDENSTFIFLHAGQIGSGSNPETSELVGMGRFIPYAPETGGLKTFVDLGRIAAHIPEVQSADGNVDSRLRILNALGIQDEEVQEVEELDDRALLITARVEEKFREDFEIQDLTRLIDVATLAPDMKLEFSDKLTAIDGLLAAMATMVVDNRERFTHYVQFTAGPFHHFLRDRFGYPVRDMFGLEDLSYDSFGNGSDDNMVSTPSVLLANEMTETFFAQPPVSKHMRNIASAIGQISAARQLVS